ncbi:2-amino-3-carboxymuconate-6-semialdehyde decarboxylase [Marinobacterium lacunae]|uniref:2-amino-3-carboxymuconate-6-semialdehyde decarboxylase n=2 Tax=Marinobacterium lacunae TaxID=1232683 RepID=A0A081FX23_9GAMM|nr:2-amino-3-carboxymuconate-6-semialdehyde decarboxylase [Marinobacterium lacunae]
MMTHTALLGIDIHAHVVPAHFPAWVDRHIPSGWPSTTEAGCHNGHCHRHVMIDGKVYRTVDDRCWSVPQRLADLPGMGLAHQVISPMPELLSYWLDADHARPLLRYLNETIAEMVAESGGTLLGLAAVPLQEVSAAIDELEYAVQQLGLVGVEIGSHINGIPLGDKQLRPFFDACVALDVPVFVHALKPTGMDRLVGPSQLQQVLAYPSDVGLAAASVITGNLLLDCPALRIAFSHGGGTFASLLPRLQQGWHTFPALRDQIAVAPAELARRLFFDTLVFDTATLRHLAATFGTSQLMLGSDYPFNFHERRPVDQVLACTFSSDVTADLVYGNAVHFLGLSNYQKGI